MWHFYKEKQLNLEKKKKWEQQNRGKKLAGSLPKDEQAWVWGYTTPSPIVVELKQSLPHTFIDLSPPDLNPF